VLIGCDCSIVVGTARALHDVSDEVHVLYLDGDYDDAPPDPERSQSAAALAGWLLTHESPFWPGPALAPSRVTGIATSLTARSDWPGARHVPLAELRQSGARAAARRALDALPPTAAILVHLDVDVFQKSELPASYFPHDEGLRWAEAHDLLGEILADPRIRLIELSEYASLRDLDGQCAAKLVELLVGALKP
jgi:arginase family enzyme